MKIQGVAMNKSRKIFCVTLAILLAAASPLFAKKKVTIKLASMMPESTAWGQALNRMSVEWLKATNGEVDLVVYHNGMMGNEGQVLRKLRMNQINAAVFSSIGLAGVMPEIMSLSYPCLIRTDDEFEEVLKRMKPELDTQIDKNGFKTLAWTRAGWLRFFSRDSVITPNDARKQKIGSSPDTPEMTQAFKTIGFRIEEVGLTELMTSLASTKIDAVYMSSIAVASYQLFGIAKNMCSINLCPFMGGMLMHKEAWRRIPDKYKPELEKITQKIAAGLDTGIIDLEKEAIATMEKYGLKVNQLSPAQEQEWYTEFLNRKSELLGPIFNETVYNRVNAILNEYRKGR
jgi:TRAP-type C4-dicarboxylate transport system substrate-binding protein